MAENLNYATGWSKCYDNDRANCQKYGRLYDWETAMKVCPSGWHLPSDEEWQELVDFAGGNGVAGQKLMAKSFNGTDDYGFSALPGGNGRSDGIFGGIDDWGDWWTATENSGSSEAYLRFIFHNDANVNRNSYDKGDLCSVRCVQDDADYEAKAETETAESKPEAIRKAYSGTFIDTRDNKNFKNYILNKYERAIENFKRAIKPNYYKALALCNSGSAYVAKGDYDRAIEDYTEALKINPAHYRDLLSRGNMYARKGDFDRAIADLEAALKIDPNNDDVRKILGLVLQKKAKQPSRN
jgi:uncharacterized protein (TIGR02145 family)